jgi:uncharacterized membrane protein YkoI
MKFKIALSGLLSASLLIAAVSGCATNQSQLRAKARVSEAQAREIALSKAPHGTIKTSELENEKGHLIWSFDIATPGTKDITEVNVDAVTGAIVAVDTESPAKEAAEAKEENEEKKGKEISEARAREIALTQAPGGTIKKADHDKEHGRWMWSFDISKPGTTDNISVDVDAVTGAILTVEVEKASGAKAATATTKKPAKAGWKANLIGADKTFSSTGRNKFFILEPGYEQIFEGEEDGKATRLVITVLNETKTVDGVETRVIEEHESQDGKVVEISRNFFALGADTHHVYYFGEDVDIYKGGKVVHEGAWHSGSDGAKYGIDMPADAAVGQKYYQERAPKVAMDRAEHVSTTEKIKTPAGSFQNCLKVKETSPLEPGVTEFKIYAPDVGLVSEGTLKLVKYGFVKK